MQINFSLNGLFLILFLVFSPQTIAMDEEVIPAKKVLSIGPGVLLGYIKIQVLEEMEKRIGRPTSELFDLIGGTSTGALIASLLTHGKPGKPTYSAKDVREFYEHFSPRIFGKKTISLSEILTEEEVKKAKRAVLNGIYKLTLHFLAQFDCKPDDALQAKLKTIIETENKEALKEILLTSLSPFYLTDRAKNYPPIESLVNDFGAKIGVVAPLLSENFYFDAKVFRSALEEKLGEHTLTSNSIAPIILFSAKTNLSLGDTVMQTFLGGGQCHGSPSEMGERVGENVIGFSASNDVKLVDAVYASSAAPLLFPPIRILYEGSLQTFSDGDVNGFSTLEGTIKEARKRWPDEHIEAFSLSFAAIDGKVIDDDKIKIHALGPSFGKTSSGKIPVATDPSKENFAVMKIIAQTYIESVEFAEIIKQFRLGK